MNSDKTKIKKIATLPLDERRRLLEAAAKHSALDYETEKIVDRLHRTRRRCAKLTAARRMCPSEETEDITDSNGKPEGG